MGIYDRDYYRDGSGGLFEVWSRQGTAIWLIVITSIAFLVQVVSKDLAGAPSIAASPFSRFGLYDPRLIVQGEVWRFLTPVFLHAGLLHLAFNMLVLYWAGTRMEERYGRREFLAFYLTAGVIANLGYFLLQFLDLMPFARALGASGAVTAVLVLYAFHYPRQQVLLFFVIPMPVWLLVVVYVGLDALGMLGGQQGDIAYAVHLSGAAFAAVYHLSGVRLLGLHSRLSDRRAAPRLRVVPANPDPDEPPEPVGAALESPPARTTERSDDPLEDRVDQVLEKVSKHGQESLTPEEREILFRASELYKKRRK